MRQDNHRMRQDNLRTAVRNTHNIINALYVVRTHTSLGGRKMLRTSARMEKGKRKAPGERARDTRGAKPPLPPRPRLPPRQGTPVKETGVRNVKKNKKQESARTSFSKSSTRWNCTTEFPGAEGEPSAPRAPWQPVQEKRCWHGEPETPCAHRLPATSRADKRRKTPRLLQCGQRPIQQEKTRARGAS